MDDKKLILSAHQIKNLLEKCASMKSITIDQMKSKHRNRENVTARQWAMYFLRGYTKMSFVQIGKLLSRDHTTVLYSCEIVSDLIRSDKTYRAEVEEIEAYISGLCRKGSTTTTTKTETSAPANHHEDYKILAESRLRTNKEYMEVIIKLRADLKIAEAQTRLYKRKMEYALIPGRILIGE